MSGHKPVTPEATRDQKMRPMQNQEMRGREIEGGSNPATQHDRESEGQGHSGNKKRSN